MTSDFDNEEIKDSTFPVDFNDETTSLDMYGVWVKNGPRTVQLETTKSALSAATPVNSSVIADFEDISNLSDLPDFSDFSESESKPTINEEIIPAIVMESIEFEEIASERDTNTEYREEIKSKKDFTSGLESISESQFDISENDEFLDIQEQRNSQEKDISVQDAPNYRIIFEDILSDELVSTGKKSKPVNDTEAIINSGRKALPEEHAEESRVFENIQFTDFEEATTNQQPKKDTAETFNIVDISIDEGKSSDNGDGLNIEDDVFEELQNFELIETDNIGGEDAQSFLPPDTDEPKEIPASQSDEFENSTVFDIEPLGELPSDEDFSSFLDDLNSGTADEAFPPVSSPDGNIDLDSFIDSFNESGGTSHDEKAKVYDDLEPVDIELDFDESFISDSEKIKATGSAITESEFFDSEFGVEMVDETTSSPSEAFNSTFESIPDFNEGPVEVSSKRVESGARQSVIEETDEFNDLLNSFDLSPTPGKPGKIEQSSQKKTYDLVVDEEDGFDLPSASSSDKKTGDDFNVPLFSSGANDEPGNEFFTDETKTDTDPSILESDPEEDFLDISGIKDYNITDSNSETNDFIASTLEESVSLDFDDISAVEQELNDFTPDTGDETVVTNDKSTELLMLIADELSSIKQELSTLKNEIAGFKTNGFSSEPSQAKQETEITDNSGFFTDDDTDETIALTGDELNNILITADFTEEKSEEGILSENEEVSQFSDELPETSDISFENLNSSSPIESPEFNMPDIGVFSDDAGETESSESEIPDTLPDSIFEISDIELNDSINVAHVNKMYEDTSYLEGSDLSEHAFDDVAIEEPELEIIDFDDEKLEEPELTEFNIDLADIENEFPPEQEVAILDETQEVPQVEELLDIETTSSEAANDIFEEISEFDTPDDTGIELAESPEIPAGNEINAGISGVSALPVDLKDEIKAVLSYMDQLLESLPEEKIEEFARSEHFDVYKKLFEELGIS